jgi:hypothetical protein
MTPITPSKSMCWAAISMGCGILVDQKAYLLESGRAVA